MLAAGYLYNNSDGSLYLSRISLTFKCLLAICLSPPAGRNSSGRQNRKDMENNITDYWGDIAEFQYVTILGPATLAG